MLNQQHEEGQREGEKTAEEGGGGVVDGRGGGGGWQHGLVFNQQLVLMRTCVSKTTWPRCWLTQAKLGILFTTWEFLSKWLRDFVVAAAVSLLQCLFWVLVGNQMRTTVQWGKTGICPQTSHYIMSWFGIITFFFFFLSKEWCKKCNLSIQYVTSASSGAL